MISFFGRHRKPIFIATTSIFLIGIFVGLGGYLFNRADLSQTVAEVGPAKISYQKFLAHAQRVQENLRDRGTEVTPQLQNEIKQDVLRDLIIETLMAQKAEEMGMQVTDLELANDIHNTPAFQKDGGFDPAAYVQAIHYLFRSTPEQYEKERRMSLLALKLRLFLFNSVKLSPGEVRESYDREDPKNRKALEEEIRKAYVKEKGSAADFEKEKQPLALKFYEQRLHQQRALETMNYYLRQLSAQVPIKSYLEQREQGL